MTLWSGPRIWSLFLLFLFFGVSKGHSLNLNYVSPETKESLEKGFEHAAFAIPNLDQTEWLCEMFGVQTGLQHEKNLALYQFKTHPSGFQNEGLSPNSNFSVSAAEKELVGKGKQVAEYIRFQSEKTLISRIVHLTSQKTLAYALCTKNSRLTAGLSINDTVVSND